MQKKAMAIDTAIRAPLHCLDGSGHEIGSGMEISVDTGEVKAGGAGTVLRAGALGSCVALVAYDRSSGVGGIAHVMLPGACIPARRNGGLPTRFAVNATGELMRLMARESFGLNDLLLFLVGGGNVLGPGHDSPGPAIVRSLMRTLAAEGLTPLAMETGGSLRRTCTLDCMSGRVMYTVGDSPQRVLWYREGGLIS